MGVMRCPTASLMRALKPSANSFVLRLQQVPNIHISRRFRPCHIDSSRSTFWRSPKFPYLLPVSIAVMVVSICIYIAAVLKLDELTMPKRFWNEDPDPAKRDPTATRLAYLEDEDLWQLQKEMVFYWWRLTIVAACLTGVSLMLMLFPLPPHELSNKIICATFGCAVVGLIVVCIYFAILRRIVAGLLDRGSWKGLFRPPD